MFVLQNQFYIYEIKIPQKACTTCKNLHSSQKLKGKKNIKSEISNLFQLFRIKSPFLNRLQDFPWASLGWVALACSCCCRYRGRTPAVRGALGLAQLQDGV